MYRLPSFIKLSSLSIEVISSFSNREVINDVQFPMEIILFTSDFSLKTIFKQKILDFRKLKSKF